MDTRQYPSCQPTSATSAGRCPRRRRWLAPLFLGMGLLAACCFAQVSGTQATLIRPTSVEPKAPRLALTDEENAWLQDHPVIRLAFDPHCPPIEMVDDHGNYLGIGADYIALIVERLGITTELSTYPSWSDALTRLMNGELDAALCLIKTPDREAKLDFTKPYLTVPYVILTDKGTRYIGTLKALSGKKVVVVRGDAVQELMNRDYPDMQLTTAPTLARGLDILARGDAIALVAGVLPVQYILAEGQYPSLHIAGSTEYVGEFAMGVRKDWPVLTRLFEKALASISEVERSAIDQKWRPIPIESSFNYTLFLQLAGAFLIILTGVFFWNRKLAFEIALRKNAETHNDHLKLAIEQTTEAVAITDREGAILYVNPAFLRMTGFTRREVIGCIMRPLQKGEANAQAEELWKTLLDGKTWEGQFKNIRKDGHPFTEQIAISPVKNKEGEIIHFVALRRDISPELKHEAERENLREQLLQSNKMESIGRLAGGIAHDFNNMLQAILGYAEMAIEQVTPDQPIYEDIESIQNAARRSTNLTKQLLIFARKQNGSYKVIDLNQAVNKMHGLLKRLIGEGAEFKWNPGSDIPTIYMDPSQLDQVLTNLCINARDAINGKGHIELSTASTLLETPLHTALGELAPGPYALISVSDDGCGMSKETAEKIFEPFFTTKASGKGTGLGLATVYGIVKQCEGGIVVRSEEGKGTVFDILIPAYAGEEEDIPLADGTGVAAAGGQQLPVGMETILLVDDEETILHAAKRMLESLGYTVIFSSDSEEAVKLAQQHKSQIKLIVSDVIMPKLNGPEMVKQILEDNPTVPYLYMSGYTANLLLEQGFSEVPKCLAKPFTRQTLAYKVRECLDQV